MVSCVAICEFERANEFEVLYGTFSTLNCDRLCAAPYSVHLCLEAGEVGVYTDRDIATAEELKTYPFHTEFLAKHGLVYFIGGSISPLPKVFTGVSVQGCLGDALIRTRPWVCSPIWDATLKLQRLSLRLVEAEAANLTLGDALSRLRSGVVIIKDSNTPEPKR